MRNKKALCLGAGGFIGSHLVKRLKAEGYFVRGVDLKYPEFSPTVADEFYTEDLRWNSDIFKIKGGFDEVYQLAADMGGAGYIFTGENDADLFSNSMGINLNVAENAVLYGVKKLFYSSSACIYPQDIQVSARGNNALREEEAYPANPDSAYGWEKIASEQLYDAYKRNYGLDVRIARFHNIYGPEGTFFGGREKAPAAMCRKVAEAEKGGFIEVWGDGQQTRSFLYIDECIEGVRRMMDSSFTKIERSFQAGFLAYGCESVNPILNIGSSEMVSINQLAELAIKASGKKLSIVNISSNALGVRGRNSDNKKIKETLGWEPHYPLEKGIKQTYDWIHGQVHGCTVNQYQREIIGKTYEKWSHTSPQGD